MAKGNPNPKQENLIPFSERSEEEAKAIRKKGAKASNEKQAKRKSFKETMNVILEMALDNKQANALTGIEDIESFIEAQGKNITVQDAMNLKQAQLALAGSTRSYEVIRDTVGERPIERHRDNDQALEKLDEVLKEIGGVI